MKMMLNPGDGRGCCLVHARRGKSGGRTLTDNESDLIALRDNLHALKQLLETWHYAGWQLVWFCGHVHHVARIGSSIGLRLNPRQLPSDAVCEFCRTLEAVRVDLVTPTDVSTGANELSKERPVKRLTIRPFFAGERANKLIVPARSAGRRSEQCAGRAQQSELGVVASLMYEAHWSIFWPNRSEFAYWRQLYDVLARIPQVRGRGSASQSMQALSWVPGPSYDGGVPGLVKRHMAYPDRYGYRREGWIFQTVDDVGTTGADVAIDIDTLAASARADAAERGDYLLRPHRFIVPQHLVVRPLILGKPVGGPYLVMLVCMLDDDDRFVVRRAILRPIVSRRWLISVDSSHERKLFLELIKRGILFNRWTVADNYGLLVDCVLHEYRIIIEVNGVDTPEYRETKKTVHARIRALYKSHVLIVWHVNDKETLEQFMERLLSLIARRRLELASSSR